MRVVALVAVAIAATLSSAWAAPHAATTAAALREAELAAATAELLAWKASPVGQEARLRGYANGSASEATADELARFVDAKSRIALLQQQQPSAQFSINTPFALLSYEEFAAKTGSTTEVFVVAAPASQEVTQLLNASPSVSTSSSSIEATSTIFATSADVDWQDYGCVTPVQHEGACNAGWAFAAVGAIETGFCIKSPSRRLYQLSKQDILTCGTKETTNCATGVTSLAFDWVANLNGGSLCTEGSLPYTRTDYEPQPCKRVDDPSVSCDKPDLQVATYVQLNSPDHRELEALVRIRAVTAMLSVCETMQFYVGGVLRGDQNACPVPMSWDGANSVRTHHDVLIVGFGTRDGVPYWKVKNSVGTYWGENGYGYIERGYQGHVYGAAGIELWNTYPLFKWEVPPAYDATRVTGPRYRVEILGDDIKTVAMQFATPEHCGEVCRREPGCKAYYFYLDDQPRCRLKASVTGERPVGSASLTASGTVIAKSEMANGLCLAPEINVDYPSDDSYHTLAASAAECCDLCFAKATCNAYTWTQYHGGSCFLKTIRSRTPTAKDPAPDGTPYFTSGVAYKCSALQFDRDYPGNDAFNLPAKGPMDCCGLCRSFNTVCGGYTWTDYNDGTCWLKTKLEGGGVYAPGVFAAAV